MEFSKERHATWRLVIRICKGAYQEKKKKQLVKSSCSTSGSHLLFTLFCVKALYRCSCLHCLQQQPQLSEIAMQHLQHSPQRRLHYLGYSNSRTFHTRLHNNTCALHRQLQHSHKDLRRTSFYRPPSTDDEASSTAHTGRHDTKLERAPTTGRSQSCCMFEEERQEGITHHRQLGVAG